MQQKRILSKVTVLTNQTFANMKIKVEQSLLDMSTYQRSKQKAVTG